MTSVLIVEDQRMPRENMEHLVEDSGRYRRVASLSTAEMALAQCARHAVNLVLMDVCTKGSRDGIDVAAEIKARYPETKVIIITSMVEESYLKRAKAAGAESFWYKDVSPESLLEVMDRTMAGESQVPTYEAVLVLGWTAPWRGKASTRTAPRRPAWGRSAAPSSPPGRSRCCGWCVRGWNMRRSPQSWASPPAP